jgi:hypothetical protein
MNLDHKTVNDSERRSSIFGCMDDGNIIGKQYQIVCVGIDKRDARMAIDVDCSRSVADLKQFFDTTIECVKYLEQSKSIDTYLIVSENQVENFIPRIPVQENIRLGYVVSQNDKSTRCDRYSERIREYGKVSFI